MRWRTSEYFIVILIVSADQLWKFTTATGFPVTLLLLFERYCIGTSVPCGWSIV